MKKIILAVLLLLCPIPLTAAEAPKFFERMESLVSNGLIENAAKELKQYLDTNKDSEKALYILTNLYRANGEFPVAIRMLEDYLKRHSESLAAYAILSGVYQDIGNSAMAVGSLEDGLAIAPDSEELNRLLGKYYFKKAIYHLHKSDEFASELIIDDLESYFSNDLDKFTEDGLTDVEKVKRILRSWSTAYKESDLKSLSKMFSPKFKGLFMEVYKREMYLAKKSQSFAVLNIKLRKLDGVFTVSFKRVYRGAEDYIYMTLDASEDKLKIVNLSRV